MNYKMVFGTVGKIVWLEAVLMFLPFCVALLYNEPRVAYAMIISIAIAAAVGTLLVTFSRTKNDLIYAKEGFITVSVSWIMLSLIGALPFTISGEIPSYIDAVFEIVSGFTTTGSSILTDVEAMSKGLLFWRSFTHWIGGMGVLVFIMAVIPNVSKRSIHIMRAEVPGPVKGKLVPRMRETAKILYLIYVVMTLVEVVLLLCGGMNFFESLVHAFGTAGTGGFGIKADSIGSYSPYLQWVITIFMILFGVNFNLYYLILIRSFKSIGKCTEVWTYLGIIFAATGLISFNIYKMYPSISETVRHAAFQVGSIITTTGYATTDFNLWPGYSKAILVALMFMGACAGSTGGGFKVSRVIIILKKIFSEIKRLLHPRSVKVMTFEGKKVDDQTVTAALTYLGIYVICMFLIFLGVSLDKFDFETNMTAVISCFNNIGPGLNVVGPMGSFAGYSVFSKILLTIAMLLGRLEIFPMIILFTPSTWRNNK